MSVRTLIGAAALAVGGAACTSDKPPAPWAALPLVGSTVPRFDFAIVGGGRLSHASLDNRITVLALWSTQCHQSRRALAALDTLLSDYRDRGVRVIAVAGDADTLVLRQVFDSAHVSVPVAAAGKGLWDVFDRSREAPERATHRVQFGLPSFVLLDSAGTVVERAAGVEPGAIHLDHVRYRLDSLLARGAP